MAEIPLPDHAAAPTEGEPRSLVITTLCHTSFFIRTCPNAQTYEAFSETLRCTVWIPLPCKRWSCRYCAEAKISHLARRCSSALPNRLLTLTVDPLCWDDPRHSFDGTRRQVPEIFRQLRRKFGEVEYLKVTELNRAGWPHYHCLVRSGFLPHSVVRDLWKDLTGASIVDLRKVEDRFKTYLYLVKYLAKMHDLGWTKRHVSYSKGFFKDTEHKQRNDYHLVEGKVLETHPATLVYHQFRNSELVEIGFNVFTLNPSDDVKQALAVPPWIPPDQPPPSAHPSPILLPQVPLPPDPQSKLFPKNPPGASPLPL